MNKFDMAITADNLKKRRKKDLHMTQAEVAEKAGITLQSLSTYENGSIPRMDILWPLADALDCEPDYLLGRIPYPKRSTSEISKMVPLSREAIESLEYLKNELDSFSNYDAAIVTCVLNSLIIGITNQIKELPIVDGKLIHEDDFMHAAMDLLFAFESIADYESLEDKYELTPIGYGHAKLAVNGLSFKIGSYLSSMVTAAIREMADPKHHIRTEV